ncbi:MAG TPA: hypothetical protein VHB77_22725, partial [Planctomycetaceae bacterium]|nr:hypothetical protein [Planctomycetaceae bacterium]
GRALPLILCLIAGIIGSTSRAEDDPAKAPQPATPGEVKISDAVLPPERDIEADILAALDKGVSISADKVPLRELMRRLSQHFDIPIAVDEKALVDEGIALDIPVSVNVTRVSLKNALRIMLNPNQLYATVKREVLLVTTAAEAVNERRISIYNVGDLISDPNDELAADRLIDLIQNATGGEPDGPWQDIDGDGGTIQFFGDQSASLMVVQQTQSVFDEIDQFLKQLRAARNARRWNGKPSIHPQKPRTPIDTKSSSGSSM